MKNPILIMVAKLAVITGTCAITFSCSTKTAKTAQSSADKPQAELVSAVDKPASSKVVDNKTSKTPIASSIPTTHEPPPVTSAIIHGEPIVKGSLDKSVIIRIVRQHRLEIKYCFENELAKDPNLAGLVNIRFIVAASGAVKAATVKGTSTLKNAAVGECMTKSIRKWAFPKPKGGGIVIVNHPFRFAPVQY